MAIFSGSFAVASAAETTMSKVEIGKAAPNFSLRNVEGKDVSLSDFANRFVVLEWFDDSCPFDKKHYTSGNMQGLQKEFRKEGVVWLVINSSGPGRPGNHTGAEYKKIMKRWKFETPDFLMDPDGKVGHLYGARTTPDIYIISTTGKLLYSGAIDDQPDTEIESLKIARNYVRAALQQALSGKPVTPSSTQAYG